MEVIINYEILKRRYNNLKKLKTKGDFEIGFKKGQLSILEDLISRCDEIKESYRLAEEEERITKEHDKQDRKEKSSRLNKIADLINLYL